MKVITVQCRTDVDGEKVLAEYSVLLCLGPDGHFNVLVFVDVLEPEERKTPLPIYIFGAPGFETPRDALIAAADRIHGDSAGFADLNPLTRYH